MRFFKSYLLIVMLTILTATSSTVHAAFPMQPAQTTTTNTETVASQTDVDFKALVTNAIEKLTQQPAPAPVYSDGLGDGEGLGIASFAVGLGGLLALAMAWVFPPLFITLSITAAITAIVLGKKSRERSRSKLGKAGLIMGIVNLSILAAAVIALFVVIAQLIFRDMN